MTDWPISLAEVREARERIAGWLDPTPLRHYPTLDAAIGHGVRVLVKHENFQPTGSFKVRNALAAVTGLDPASRARGVIAATAGNHGLGLAYGGKLLGVRVTICVQQGNNPDKNAGMRALGAQLVEEGRDYDDAVAVADRIQAERGLTLVHSTQNRSVLAGAGTIALELVEQAGDVDAVVVALGGGSQAVGMMTVLRELKPHAAVYAVQAAGAAAMYEAWRTGEPRPWSEASTFADGIRTRTPYPLTLPALRAGLAGFVTVSDGEIAAALRLALRTTHTLVEGAAAAALAGLSKLAPKLAGGRVTVVFSGANIDEQTLRHALAASTP